MTNNFKPVCDTMTEHQPIVEELIALLKSRPDLAVALKESIRKADRPDVATLAQYNDFLNKMVTLIPTNRNLNPLLLKFYYLIDLSPDNVLQTDASFQQWSRKFARDWGAFLDTAESARGIKSFFSNSGYHIEDYCAAPSGMAQVSSVNLTAQAGAELVKGEEFGFFAFGGSDIVTLFEAGRVKFDARVGTHYNQGRSIGHAVNG